MFKTETLLRNHQRKAFTLNKSSIELSLQNFLKHYCKPEETIRIHSTLDITKELAQCINLFRQLNIIYYKQILKDVTNEDDQFGIMGAYHVGKTNHPGVQEMLKVHSEKIFSKNV